jgi:tryptophan-rich sensory protein
MQKKIVATTDSALGLTSEKNASAFTSSPFDFVASGLWTIQLLLFTCRTTRTFAKEQQKVHRCTHAYYVVSAIRNFVFLNGFFKLKNNEQK